MARDIWLSEAAKLRGVSIDTVYDLCVEGELPHIKLGSVFRIKVADLALIERPKELLFHLEPDEWVVAWPDRPAPLEPLSNKQIRDLQPGDRVTYDGKETTVLGVVNN